MTGRKVICDTYSGHGSRVGGAFSGKKPSGVDRSGSHAARYVAKNVVRAGLADKCQVQVAQGTRVADPLPLLIDTHGTGRIPDEEIEGRVLGYLPPKPAAIVEELKLEEADPPEDGDLRALRQETS